jgi:hypothetical protein
MTAIRSSALEIMLSTRRKIRKGTTPTWLSDDVIQVSAYRPTLTDFGWRNYDASGTVCRHGDWNSLCSPCSEVIYTPTPDLANEAELRLARLNRRDTT